MAFFISANPLEISFVAAQGISPRGKLFLTGKGEDDQKYATIQPRRLKVT
jgi:hypothetical protein